MTTRILPVGAALLAALGFVQPGFAQAPVAPAPAAAAPAAANPNHGPIMTTLKNQWISVRDRIIPISDQVPENLYDWRPTPETMSFRQMILHVTTEGYFFLNNIATLQGAAIPDSQVINALTTKADVMKALRDSYDWQGRVIDGLTEAQAAELVQGRGRGGAMAPRWNGILGLIVDNMDHYGNLVTMTRINGMVPPASAGRAGRGARGAGVGAGAAPGAAGARAGAAPAAATPATPPSAPAPAGRGM